MSDRKETGLPGRFAIATAPAAGHEETPFPARLRNFDLASLRGFDPLHRNSFLDVRVDKLQDDYLCLSVAIPETMLRGFVVFLEAMGGLISVYTVHYSINLKNIQVRGM